MKLFHNWLILVLLASSFQTAEAGTGGGLVTSLLVHAYGGNGSGTVMFETENNSNKAACSTVGQGSAWAVSLEHEYGRAMYALLLSAKAQGKPISVIGEGDCAAWGDRERPAYIHTID
jgi:hypothetical protein